MTCLFLFPLNTQTWGDKSRLRCVKLRGLAYAQRLLGGSYLCWCCTSPSWGSRLPGASFSLLFSPEESQLSHSLPVTHSGGRTESETSAETQSFKLLQIMVPGCLQEPPGKTTLPFGGTEPVGYESGFLLLPGHSFPESPQVSWHPQWPGGWAAPSQSLPKVKPLPCNSPARAWPMCIWAANTSHIFQTLRPATPRVRGHWCYGIAPWQDVVSWTLRMDWLLGARPGGKEEGCTLAAP